MSNGPALTHAKGLRLSLGVAPLFEDVDFTLHRGERACLVGANGAGKSTLMRMLAGLAEPDSGEISFASGTLVAYTPQEPELSEAATLREYACIASTPELRRLAPTPAHAAEAELHAFGLDPERSPKNLSGGEARRAALARALASEADLLLLDEPTNHLDISAIEALEQRITTYPGACLIISHDRRFLERVSTATLWLRQRKIIKLGKGYCAFADWAEQVEIEEARATARLETHLKAEEHWLQRGVTARRSRNEGRRRRLLALRAERRERTALAATASAKLAADQGSASGKLVIDAKTISKSYGETPIINGLSLRVMRGDRIGIVGPNGAGKTTLLEVLLKWREPDQGEVRHGAQLEIAYVDQTRDLLNAEASIWDTFAPHGGDQIVVRGHPRHVAAYAQDFLFSGAQLRQPVSALSGGERNRLALALTLAKPANLLVLDEPTNDLDIETLDALEDMLAAYDGTVIVVSHDRAFLDGVATQIVGPIGKGKWAESAGGWSDFEREFGKASASRSAPARKSAPAPAPAARKQTKLSYHEERRTGELEASMRQLNLEIADLEASLADAEAFARDPAAFERGSARLSAARAAKDAAETEWLDLELKREALQAP